MLLQNIFDCEADVVDWYGVLDAPRLLRTWWRVCRCSEGFESAAPFFLVIKFVAYARPHDVSASIPTFRQPPPPPPPHAPSSRGRVMNGLTAKTCKI